MAMALGRAGSAGAKRAVRARPFAWLRPVPAAGRSADRGPFRPLTDRVGWHGAHRTAAPALVEGRDDVAEIGREGRQAGIDRDLPARLQPAVRRLEDRRERPGRHHCAEHDGRGGPRLQRQAGGARRDGDGEAGALLGEVALHPREVIADLDGLGQAVEHRHDLAVHAGTIRDRRRIGCHGRVSQHLRRGRPCGPEERCRIVGGCVRPATICVLEQVVDVVLDDRPVELPERRRGGNHGRQLRHRPLGEHPDEGDLLAADERGRIEDRVDQVRPGRKENGGDEEVGLSLSAARPPARPRDRRAAIGRST